MLQHVTSLSLLWKEAKPNLEAIGVKFLRIISFFSYTYTAKHHFRLCLITNMPANNVQSSRVDKEIKSAFIRTKKPTGADRAQYKHYKNLYHLYKRS
jgi:hypothetical protein